MNIEQLEDSVGNVICTGSIVRMFHFATTKRKYFFYKQYLGLNKFNRAEFRHLDNDCVDMKQTFDLALDSPTLSKETVVVSCTCPYHIYNDLKRNPKLRD